MQSITLAGLLALISGLAVGYIPETTTRFSLNPSTRNVFKACTTKLGVDGRCVHSSFCNDMKYEIEHGGIILESELRSLECNLQTEWCCSEKNVTKTLPPKPEHNKVDCIVTNRPDCPWCVKLYRDGADPRIPSSGFFCMGTMIGPNVILSTGTCMVQAHKQNLTAVIPSSAKPDNKYLVTFRILHPQYNSGTRANDLALFVVHPDVEWDSTGPKGACLGLSAELTGDCIGTGVDYDENIDLTPLLVKSGVCDRGDDIDAACGHVIGEDCSVVPGAPIMCRVKGGALQMVGFSKLTCTSDTTKVLLSHLNAAKTWISNTLQGVMGLEKKTFSNE